MSVQHDLHKDWRHSLRQFFFGSLRRQLVIAVVAVHAVMMSFFVADLSARHQHFVKQQLSAEAKILARTLALAASSGVLSRDMAGLQELVEVDSSATYINFVMLIDSNGSVLAHSQRDRVGLYLKDLPELRQAKPGVATVLSQSDEGVDSVAPIESAGRIIGWARVGVGHAATQSAQNAITRDGLLYTAAAILIGGLLALWMSNRLTARLNAIRATAEAVREGKTEVRAPVKGIDETSIVAQGFNTMLDALQSEKSELKHVQAELETSRERLELALRGSNDGLWDWDIGSNTVYFSPRWKSMLGYAENELGNTREAWRALVHPIDLSQCLDAIQAHIDGKTPHYEHIHRIRHKDGHWVWVLVRGLCHRNAEGQALRMVGTHTDISPRVEIERELTHYKQALDHHAIVSMTDASGTIIHANSLFSGISGYSQEELLGANHRIVSSGVHPREFFREMWRTISSGHVWHGEVCNRAKNGQNYWVLSTIFPFLGEDGRPERYFSIRADITARKHAEQALFAEKELAQITLRSIGDGIITTDAEGRITFMNPVAERLTGWLQDEANGKPVEQILKRINEETGESADNLVERCHRSDSLTKTTHQTLMISRSGNELAIEETAAPIHDKEGWFAGVVIVFHDVTPQRKLSREMAWQLSHDTLTGLANRTAFEQKLQELLLDIDPQAEHAMLYLDLDQFKVVNETGGHQAGDELLKRLAGLLEGQLRDADTFARLGGDEFGVLLRNCPGAKAKEIGNKLRNLIRDFRFGWDNRQFEVGVSIGITPISPGTHSLADVMTAADMACYAAKELGRNRIHMHHAGDSEMVTRRQMLHAASGIRLALEEDRFVLYGQEIRPLQANPHKHYEVLIRMLDEDGQIVAPGVFIPAAESFGLMSDVDRWVVRKAFAALTQDNDINLAINLSGLSLQSEGFVDFVREIKASSGVDAARVCFEITETAAISNLSRAQVFFTEMKALGFSFSLDDFGSGMSSFGYLKSLPVDFLKIDGAFVRDIVSDPIDHAFVEAINRIGQVMGKETIAEYVENDEIMQKLIAIGVNYAQGYGVAKPVPLESLLNISR